MYRLSGIIWLSFLGYVIELLRDMKSHAQLSICTHNANFPVLDDAEQVKACRYQDETVIMQSGSVDSHPVQELLITSWKGPGGL